MTKGFVKVDLFSVVLYANKVGASTVKIPHTEERLALKPLKAKMRFKTARFLNIVMSQLQ